MQHSKHYDRKALPSNFYLTVKLSDFNDQQTQKLEPLRWIFFQPQDIIVAYSISSIIPLYVTFLPGKDPDSINFDPPTLEDGSRVELPVLVMAGNRPQYLFRMLKTLRGVQGLIPSMVTVFIDGFFDEPALVAGLLGLKVEQHEGVSTKNSRICQVRVKWESKIGECNVVVKIESLDEILKNEHKNKNYC